jgi:hypothetical protein
MGADHDERVTGTTTHSCWLDDPSYGDFACYGRNFIVMVWTDSTNLLFRHFNIPTENIKAGLWPVTSACHYRS